MVIYCTLIIIVPLESYLNERIENAVVTVPAYFNDSQRQVSVVVAMSRLRGRYEHPGN